VARPWQATVRNREQIPQLPGPQGDRSEARSGCAGQYSLDDVAREGEPSLGFGQLRRGGPNEAQTVTDMGHERESMARRAKLRLPELGGPKMNRW
jgi:hypothetical protein